MDTIFSDHISDILIFPSRVSRDYWSRTLSKTFNCIPLHQFTTFYHFQFLLLQTLNPLCKYHRILSQQEQVLMMHSFLNNTEIHTLIMVLEQAGVSSYNEQSSLDSSNSSLSVQYADKLLRIFSLYVSTRHIPLSDSHSNQQEYNKTNDNFTTTIEILLSKYCDMLFQYNCIDYIALSYNFSKYCTWDSIPKEYYLRAHIVSPQIWNPQHIAWLHNHGMQDNNHSDSSIHPTLSLFSYQNITHMDEYVPHIMRNKYSVPFTQRVIESCGGKVDKTIDSTGDSNTNQVQCWEFSSVYHELNMIFSAINQLLHTTSDEHRIHAHDILLTICSDSPEMLSMVTSIASKYNVPISYHINNAHINTTFIEHVNEVYNTHASLSALSCFLLEPSFPWKYRSHHFSLLELGNKYSCVNDVKLQRWKFLLKDNEVLHAYFESLMNSIEKLIKAKSFHDLYTNISYFFNEFFNFNSAQTFTFNKSIVLKKIRTYMVFENYVSNMGDIGDNNQLAYSPWKIFELSCRGKSMRSSKHSCVQVSALGDSLGAEYPYWFVCNLSQQALFQITSYPQVFNDYLSSQYTAEHTIKMYDQYVHAILDYFKERQQSLFLSGSTQSLGGAQIIPVYWKRQIVSIPSYQYDIWEQEKHYLSSGQIPSRTLSNENNAHYMFTHAQKQGMAHYHTIQYFKKKTILNNGISKELYSHILHHKSIRISPTSITDILDPYIFLFQHVLGVKDLFDHIQSDYDLTEKMLWGGIYHEIIEQCLQYEITTHGTLAQYVQELSNTDNNTQKNIDTNTYLSQVFPTGLLSLLIKNRVPYILHDCILSTIAQFDIQDYVSHIAQILYEQSNQGEFMVERISKVALSDLITHYSYLNDHVGSSAIDFSHIYLSGRSDIVYKCHDNRYFIIDLKTKKGDKSVVYKHLFQLWIYHLLWNKEQDDVPIYLIDSQRQQAMGQLYYITEPINQRLMYAPNSTTGNDLFLVKIPYLFRWVLERNAHLYEEGSIERTPVDDEEILSYYQKLQPTYSLNIKSLLREGAYIYVK